MSLRLDGKVASLSIKQQLKEEFLKLDKKACLAIIHYPDGANASYLKGRMKIAEELNVEIKVYEINENDTTSSLLQVIETFNNNKDIHGIMVDRPLPRKFDESSILASMNALNSGDGVNIPFDSASFTISCVLTPSAYVLPSEYCSNAYKV